MLDFHPSQLKIYENPARFKIVCAGRRFGKSQMSIISMMYFALLNPSSKVVYFAPTISQARDIVWNNLKTYSKTAGLWAGEPNESRMEISIKNIDHAGNLLPTTSVIWLRGTENIESARGNKIDYLIVDEVASMRNWGYIWADVLRPTLTDSQGHAMFISCVTKDTLILGEHLQEIGESKDGYNEHNKNYYGLGGYHLATHKFGGGLQKTLKITTTKGYKIECTPNHMLWTLNGWKRSDAFKLGDFIQIQYGQNVFPKIFNNDFVYKKRKSKLPFDTTLTKDLSYLIGLYIAEGCKARGKITITNGDEEIGKFLVDKYSFKRVDKFHYISGNMILYDFLDYLELGNGAKNKNFGKTLQFTKEQQVEVLKGYFDGDGFSDSKRFRIGATSISEKLISQLQVMLLNYGVVSKVTKSRTKPTKKVKVFSDVLNLTIENDYACNIFYKEIGFRLSRKQQKFFPELKNTYKTWFQRSDFKKLNSKFGYLKRHNLIETHTLEEVLKIAPNEKYSLDFSTDTIKSIENSENFVYDFVIPDTHSFFTNGFVSHNTPKGFNHFYQMFNREKEDKDYASFRFTTYDNPFLVVEEIEKAKLEVDDDTFKQEYMAEFVSVSGQVYKEFDVVRQFTTVEYDPYLDLHVSIDFGVNDPTSIIWIQPNGSEYRVIDYHEEQNANVDYFSALIKSKPYREPSLFTGDPAGNARSIVTNTSPIEEYARHGIHIRSKTGVKIPEQIRITHKHIKSMYVDNRLERFRDCILNYRYPDRKQNMYSTSNENPIHDEYCITGDTKVRTLNGWAPIKDLVGKEFYVWGYSLKENKLVPTKATKCWKTKENAEIIEVGLDDGHSIKCTPNHKFLLRNKTYIEAKDLKEGDSLMPFYEQAKVTFIRPAGTADVYDMTVPETSNFVAEGVVIHNSHSMRALEYYFINIDSGGFMNRNLNIVLPQNDISKWTFE